MDNKSIILPTILKGGANYLLWARTTKTALCGKGLWTHIEEDGDSSSTIKERAENKVWFQEDQAVLGLLQNSLDASILEAYSYCETAKDLWITLKNVFGNTSNLTRVFEVKKAINNLRQEDMEFTEFFGKFRSLWAELEMLRPSTVDPAVLNERREQDKVFALLLTLNPHFNDLIKQLLRANTLPSLDEACSQIIKEQGSSNLFNIKGDIPMANKVEVAPMANKGGYKGNNFNKDYKPPWCTHFKRRGQPG